MLLCCLEGETVSSIAAKFGVRPNTVIDYRKRFEEFGLGSLQDRQRTGRPVEYDEQFGHQVLAMLEKNPPDGMGTWDGPTLARELHCSADAVWRFLKKKGICLSRQRSWCVSTDPDFIPKAADIVGLYLNPPENALVLSVDEKPSIQALERRKGYVLTSSGKIVNGLRSTYKRNGTLNLFAALNVATGAICGKVTQYKKKPDFISFMDQLVAEYPAEQEIHVILDNYCIHKKNDSWLEAHPNVTFHYTPTSASWLNQIEIWFGIFSRKVLRGSSHNKESLGEAIESYIKAYNRNPQPFVWKKREVKGAQLRNTISNLCK